jgi:hypothetical protein
MEPTKQPGSGRVWTIIGGIITLALGYSLGYLIYYGILSSLVTGNMGQVVSFCFDQEGNSEAQGCFPFVAGQVINRCGEKVCYAEVTLQLTADFDTVCVAAANNPTMTVLRAQSSNSEYPFEITLKVDELSLKPADSMLIWLYFERPTNYRLVRYNATRQSGQKGGSLPSDDDCIDVTKGSNIPTAMWVLFTAVAVAFMASLIWLLHSLKEKRTDRERWIAFENKVDNQRDNNHQVDGGSK